MRPLWFGPTPLRRRASPPRGRRVDARCCHIQMDAARREGVAWFSGGARMPIHSGRRRRSSASATARTSWVHGMGEALHPASTTSVCAHSLSGDARLRAHGGGDPAARGRARSRGALPHQSLLPVRPARERIPATGHRTPAPSQERISATWHSRVSKRSATMLPRPRRSPAARRSSSPA